MSDTSGSPAGPFDYNIPRPPAALIDAAARDIPAALSEMLLRTPGEETVQQRDLLRRLTGQHKHGKAASLWAIYRLWGEERLTAHRGLEDSPDSVSRDGRSRSREPVESRDQNDNWIGATSRLWEWWEAGCPPDEATGDGDQANAEPTSEDDERGNDPPEDKAGRGKDTPGGAEGATRGAAIEAAGAIIPPLVADVNPARPVDVPNDSPAEQIARADRLAYLAFCYAESKAGKRLQDRDAYNLLSEEGIPDTAGARDDLEGYELPAFDTWARYLRNARRQLGEQKNTCRGGRPHGKSVTSGDRIE